VKKSDLKKLLKPLVKECIKECLYEEGVLSSVVSEVVKGMGTNIIQEKVEPIQPVQPVQPARPVRNSNVLKEQRKMLLDAVGKDSYGGVNIFEDVTPTRAQTSTTAASSPLGDIDPGDPGIDISGIVALGGKKWKAFTQ